MDSYNRYRSRSRIIRILPIIALLLLGTACQGRSGPVGAHWDAKDPSCRVAGMRHICERACRVDEIGPSGKSCFEQTTAEGTYCDCGTR